MHSTAAMDHLLGNRRMPRAASRRRWRSGGELGEVRREAAAENALGLARLDRGEVQLARRRSRSRPTSGIAWESASTRARCAPTSASWSRRAALCRRRSPATRRLRALFHEVGDRSQEARILNNLGGVYDLQGEPDAALDHYRQALALRQELARSPRARPRPSTTSAVVHRALGEWQEALRIYGQVREILPPLGDRCSRGLAAQQPRLRLQQPGRAAARPRLSGGGPEAAPGDRRPPGRGHHAQQPRPRLAQSGRSAQGARPPPAGLELRRGSARPPAGGGHPAAPRRGPARAAGLRRPRSASSSRRSPASQRRAIGAARPRPCTFAGVRSPSPAGRRRRCPVLRGGADAAPDPARPRRRGRDALRPGRRRSGRSAAPTRRAPTPRRRWPRVEELRTGFVSPDLRAAFLATAAPRLLAARSTCSWTGTPPIPPAATTGRPSRSASGPARAACSTSCTPGAAHRRQRASRRAARAPPVPAPPAERQGRSAAAGEQGGGEGEALGREIETPARRARRRRGRDPPARSALRRLRRRLPRRSASRRSPALLDPGTLLLEYSLGEERSYLWAVGAEAAPQLRPPARAGDRGSGAAGPRGAEHRRGRRRRRRTEAPEP